MSETRCHTCVWIYERVCRALAAPIPDDQPTLEAIRKAIEAEAQPTPPAEGETADPICPWCDKPVKPGTSPFRKAHWPCLGPAAESPPPAPVAGETPEGLDPRLDLSHQHEAHRVASIYGVWEREKNELHLLRALRAAAKEQRPAPTPEGLSAEARHLLTLAAHRIAALEAENQRLTTKLDGAVAQARKWNAEADRYLAQRDELTVENQQLRAREPAGNPLTACHITPDATGTPLCGASDGAGTIRLAHYQAQAPHVASLRICPACAAAEKMLACETIPVDNAR